MATFASQMTFYLEIIVFEQVENISALKLFKSETVVVGDAHSAPQYRHRYNRITHVPSVSLIHYHPTHQRRHVL
jgi:hypothetical protein